MNRSIKLGTAPDQGIELTLRGALRQVRRESAERIRRDAFGLLAAHHGGAASAFCTEGLVAELRLAVADVAKQVEARDALRSKQSHGMRVGFIKDRHKEIPDLHFFLLGTLRVINCRLDHAVKREGLCRFNRVIPGHAFEILIEESFEVRAQSVHVRTRMEQDLRPFLVMNQGLEQMLHRQVRVTPRLRFAIRRLQRELKIAADGTHSFSTPDRSGYPRSSAIRCTVADFVSATSNT